MRGCSRARLATLAASAVLLAACSTLEDPPAATIDAMPGLGEANFAVTARDAQARRWFGQGLQLAYAFEHEEAARVFRAALARDPSCAMCAWGLAYALGPNINDSDRGPVREIRRHIERAQQAASGVTPKERALINAMAVRYGRADERAQQTYEALGSAVCSTRKSERKMDPQELAYAAAMADVLKQYPDDPDVITLHADAVMSTMPWEWWDPKTGQPNGAVAEVIARLAATVKAHPEHTGALHFYVHLSEHSPAPEQAALAADTLGRVAPAAPHLVHMGSHVYKNIGRFADGTRANEEALAVQKRFDAALQSQGVRRRGRWDAHHLHFLWYASLMEGRTSLALGTARQYAQRYGLRGDGYGDYAQILPLATLVRLERWQAVLAEPVPTGGVGLKEGYDAYARGMAHAHTGRLDLAKAQLAELQRWADQPTLQRARMYDEPVPAQMLAIARDHLGGTIARAEGRPANAAEMLRKAADADDELGTDPPLLGGGARLALAGALMEAGQLDEASREITEALRRNGPSTWSHQAQAQLSERRGAREESLRHAALARAAWAAADEPTLPGL